MLTISSKCVLKQAVVRLAYCAGTRPQLPRLVRAVLDHQGGGLRDDATLLLVQWTGI